MRGAQIQKHKIVTDISQGELMYLKSEAYQTNKGTSEKAFHHNYPRIVMQGITGVNEKHRLKMTLAQNGEYCANSVNYITHNDINVLKYLLGLLNSNLIEWYFLKLSTNSKFNGYEVDNLPIKISSGSIKIEIINLVDKCLNNDSVDEFRKNINELVYKIYGISDNEREIIEGHFLL